MEGLPLNKKIFLSPYGKNDKECLLVIVKSRENTMLAHKE